MRTGIVMRWRRRRLADLVPPAMLVSYRSSALWHRDRLSCFRWPAGAGDLLYACRSARRAPHSRTECIRLPPRELSQCISILPAIPETLNLLACTKRPPAKFGFHIHCGFGFGRPRYSRRRMLSALHMLYRQSSRRPGRSSSAHTSHPHGRSIHLSARSTATRCFFETASPYTHAHSSATVQAPSGCAAIKAMIARCTRPGPLLMI